MQGPPDDHIKYPVQEGFTKEDSEKETKVTGKTADEASSGGGDAPSS